MTTMSLGVLTISTPGNTTYQNDIFLFGSVQRDAGTSDKTDTLPTAVNMIDAVAPTATSFTFGNQFYVTLANISATNSITLVTNTGVTLVGGTTLLPNSAVELTLHILTTTTCVVIVQNTNTTQSNSAITPSSVKTSTLTLTGASNQLIAQPGGSGNTTSFNFATPGQNTVLTVPDPASTSANITLTKGATSVSGAWNFTNSLPIEIQPGGSGNAYTFTVAGNPAQNTAINFYDPGYTSTLLLFGQRNVITMATTGTTTLTTAQSGSVILVPTSTGAMTLTLPNPTSGLNYLVLLGNTLASGALTINNANSSNIIGTVISADGTAVTGGAITSGTGDKVITVSTSATGSGDSYEFIGLGSKYFVRGFTTLHTAVTFS
jgi:hypothetical protein